MNERIQKLAQQANLQLIIDDDLTLRKFADKLGELIIEECARVAARTECPYTDEIIRKQHGHTWDMACVAAAKDIRLHFEVEDLTTKELSKDADEWYEKLLWDEKK